LRPAGPRLPAAIRPPIRAQGRSSKPGGNFETFAAVRRSRGVTINSPSAMKLISFLSAAAFIALGVSLLALSLGASAVGSYATAASTLVVLGAVRDYTPRRSCWEPGRTGTARFPSAPAGHSERLAA